MLQQPSGNFWHKFSPNDLSNSNMELNSNDSIQKGSVLLEWDE